MGVCLQRSCQKTRNDVWLIFQEHFIAEKEFKFKNEQKSAEDQVTIPKPNRLGLGAICLSYFLFFSLASFRETLGTAFVQDMYAMTDDVVLLYMNIALLIAGVFAMGVFLTGARLARRFDERLIVICIGYGLVIIGLIAHYPIGDTPLITASENCTTNEDVKSITFNSSLVFPEHEQIIDEFPLYRMENSLKSTENNSSDPCLGCPSYQEWCKDTHQIPLPQLIISYILTLMGGPLVNSLSIAVFSKVLGPNPQGFWMGVLQGCNSMARITGPLWLSAMYQSKGYMMNYLTLTILLSCGCLSLIVNFKNIAPMKLEEKKKGLDNLALETTKDEEYFATTQSNNETK